MYKYDTHIHTCDVSSCATASGEYQVKAYKDAGYDGIMITNHFFNGSTCAVPPNLSWEERVHLYCKGYEDAKRTGDQIGLKVFFGWEETHLDQDFLIYGLDKEWLLNHPEMEHWTVKKQFEEVNRLGGLVVHAHPFRNRPYIEKIRLYPKHVHAVEAFNASNYEDENQQAYLYAKDYDLPITAGSDSHHHNIICSGIRVMKPFNSIHDYIKLIKENAPKEIIFP